MGPVELNVMENEENTIAPSEAKMLSTGTAYLFNNPSRRGMPDFLPAGWQVVKITPCHLNRSFLDCCTKKKVRKLLCCCFADVTLNIFKDSALSDAPGVCMPRFLIRLFV